MTVRRGFASALLGLACILAPHAAWAQQGGARAPRDSAATDTAHVTYQTSEVIFVSAGRAAGLAVGDTLAIESRLGQRLGRAVVLSVADSSASAALLPPAPAVAIGERVRFARHRLEAAAPPPTGYVDTAVAARRPARGALRTPAAAPPAAPAPAQTPARPWQPPRRWRANIQIDQSAASSGGPQALTTYQTSAATGLTAPVASWLTLQGRSTTRWRNGSTGLSAIGLTGTQTWVYQLELRVGPSRCCWNFSLGRFLPADAPGLGYLDGARLEVQPTANQHLGVVGGYTPDIYTMGVSKEVARGGVYWAVTGPTFSGSVSGAADYEARQIRRSWLSTSAFWTPSPRVSFSFMTDVDHGAGWESFRGLEVTNLSAGVRFPLPLGFHMGLTGESHAALRLYQTFLAGDTLPLPGRLTGATASLGRQIWGAALELSAGYLKRATDANPTYQGTLSLYSRHFMIFAMGQHGDLFNFGSAVLRLPLGFFTGPLTASLSFGANVTSLPGGAATMWRYDVTPELGWRLGGGFYLSASGDFGKYAGLTSTYLRAGVGYQVW